MAGRLREVYFDPGRMDAVADGTVVASRDQILERMQYLVGCAVDELPEPQRGVIEGVYWECASYSELAVRYGFAHRSSIMRIRREAESAMAEKLEGTECEKLWRTFCEARRRTTSRLSRT